MPSGFSHLGCGNPSPTSDISDALTHGADAPTGKSNAKIRVPLLKNGWSLQKSEFACPKNEFSNQEIEFSNRQTGLPSPGWDHEPHSFDGRRSADECAG